MKPKGKKLNLFLVVILSIFFISLFNLSSFAATCNLPGDFVGLMGDPTPDGKVDFNDLMVFATTYGSETGDPNWNALCDICGYLGDPTPDGKVNFDDLMVFATNYGKNCVNIITPTLNDPGTSVSSGISYTVTWSDESGSGATKYTLQEDISPDFSGAQNYALTETSGSFSRIVDSDTTFYYRVRSENDTEQSAWSSTADMLVTPVSPPDTPVINDPGNSVPSGTSYIVSWSDESGSGANHYQLQEATTADFSGAQNYSLTTTSKSFTHDTFEDTTYYYRVVAENTVSSQYSDWSNSVDITVNGGIPSIPTLDDPGAAVNSGIPYNITWSDESGNGATSYLLQEDTVDSFSSALSYTTSNNLKSFTHSVLSDTTYYYRVAALNSNGQSGWSTTKSKIVNAVDLAEWTVMIYLNGDNTLESQVWDDLTEMETVGSKNGVNIIAQMDDASTPGTYRYFVTGSTQGSTKPYYPDDIISSLSEQNMAEPAVLSDFVNWATSSYPAKKYLLILRGTGQGWKGLLEDTSSSDKMTLQELVQGLSGINSHIDVLGLDASYMQMAEVVYAIGDGLTSPPDYLVGSQEIIWDNGWDYYDILDQLTSIPTWVPATCAGKIALTTSYNSAPTNTGSAIDLPGFMSNAKTVIDDLANALKNSAYPSEIATARVSTQSYTGHPEFKDLYHFTTYTYDANDCDDESQLVMDLVDNNIIDNGWEGLAVKDSNGVSIYLPDTPAGYDTEYNSLQFAQDTLWDEFLQNITTVVKPTVTTIGCDSITETSATCYGRINSTGGERANRIGIEYQDLISGGGILDKYQTGDYGDEDFSRGLINLTAGHNYQYRAYADNPTAGRGYGEWKQFTTIPEDPVMPDVSTYGTDQIGSSTATAHGKVNSTGGAIITERGFTYGLTEAANTWTVSETDSFGEGFFEMDLSGLQSSTTYYIKAFATNSVGTDYGPWDMFTTTGGTPDPGAPDTPTLYDPGTTAETGEQYLIDWSEVSGATNYLIQESTSSAFNINVSTYSGPDTEKYFGHNIADIYYYRVAAENSNGQSGWSNIESIEVVESEATYRLLGIGIADYPGYYDDHGNWIEPDLSAPVLDAQSIKTLYNHHKFDFAFNDYLENANATNDDILSAIMEIAFVSKPQDVTYFYFSGHGGVYTDTEDSFLKTYGGTINVSTLERWLDFIQGTVVVLLDSCNSGDFIGKDVGVEEFDPAEFNAGVITAFSNETLSRDNLAQPKFQVLTACRSDQLSMEWPPPTADYGVFTAYYRAGCGYETFSYPCPANTDSNPAVSLHEAYKYVKDHVPNWLPLIDQDVQIYPWGSDFPVMEY